MTGRALFVELVRLVLRLRDTRRWRARGAANMPPPVPGDNDVPF